MNLLKNIWFKKIRSLSLKLQNSDTKSIILNLKSKYSARHDNISTILLKILQPILTPVLTPIINQSLVSGIFPVKLKIAKIIPIFKKEDSHFLENY